MVPGPARALREPAGRERSDRCGIPPDIRNPDIGFRATKTYPSSLWPLYPVPGVAGAKFDRGVGRVQTSSCCRNWVTPCFGVASFFVRTIFETTTDPTRTPGGCGQNCVALATPPDQAPTEALLGASDK